MTASVAAVMTPAEAGELDGWWSVGTTEYDQDGAPVIGWIVFHGGPGDEGVSLRAYREDRWDWRFIPEHKIRTLKSVQQVHKLATKPVMVAVPAVMAHLLTSWPVSRCGEES